MADRIDNLMDDIAKKLFCSLRYAPPDIERQLEELDAMTSKELDAEIRSFGLDPERVVDTVAAAMTAAIKQAVGEEDGFDWRALQRLRKGEEGEY